MNSIKFVNRTYTFLLLLVLFALVCMGCMDVSSYEFTDLEALEKSNLIENGWVYWDIPETSFQIRVRTDLDTNKVWMSLKYTSLNENYDDFPELANDINLDFVYGQIGVNPGSQDELYLVEQDVLMILNREEKQIIYFRPHRSR